MNVNDCLLLLQLKITSLDRIRTKDIECTGLMGRVPLGANPPTVTRARARIASPSICAYLFLWFVLANLRVTGQVLSFTGRAGQKDPHSQVHCVPANNLLSVCFQVGSVQRRGEIKQSGIP